jgi:hypothetical protein
MRRKHGADYAAAQQLYHRADAKSFEIARRLNEKGLQWLAHLAAADELYPLEIFRHNRDLWRKLDGRACLRAARIPIVLLNCNFQYAEWWASVVSHGVPPIINIGNDRLPIAEDTQAVLRDLLAEARTIAVTEPGVANLVLGAPSATVRLIASMTLPDIDWISVRYVRELRPRWTEKAVFWRNLLLASLGETEDELSDLHCLGLQLLGSELLANIRTG